jgi:N-acylneuraminate cytidylyltransferase
MKIAVIPARGGSKRIPRKNIKSFCGKPMIAWSIEAALSSNIFDKVIVSTDDKEIADIALKYGAEVPFIRPAELSDDFTGTIPVIKHAIQWYQEKLQKVDTVCCIYATAPFIQGKYIVNGYDALVSSDADYVFSVTTYAFPIQRALQLNDEQRIQMYYPENFNTRSQDLEEVWHDAGQFYWGTNRAWLAGLPIFSSGSIPIVLPRYLVQDIDTIEDWKYAELMFKAMKDD